MVSFLCFSSIKTIFRSFFVDDSTKTHAEKNNAFRTVNTVGCDINNPEYAKTWSSQVCLDEIDRSEYKFKRLFFGLYLNFKRKIV